MCSEIYGEYAIHFYIFNLIILKILPLLKNFFLSASTINAGKILESTLLVVLIFVL